jgi:uncharacterized membrane protein
VTSEVSSNNGGALPAVERRARALSVAIAIVQTAFLLGYPFLVLLGLARFGARWAALLLLVVIGLGRLGSLRRDLNRARRAPGLWLSVTALLAASALLDDPRFMLAYPALVSGVLLAQFAWSLHKGRPMVELFARREAEDLSDGEVKYCRTVTAIWSLFFALNGLAAAALALWGPRSWWAIYTGGVSYGLIAALFAGEYLVRKARFGRYGRNPLDQLLGRLFGNGAARP